MPDMSNAHPGYLAEARIRAENARQIIAGSSAAQPALTTAWRQIHDSVADVPVLADEADRLSRDLTEVRLDRANLAAAGRATINAWRNSEEDPLSYLRDELTAQGFAGRSA